MNENEQYLGKIEAAKKIRGFKTSQHESIGKKTPEDLGIEAARMCTPYFNDKRLRWELIGGKGPSLLLGLINGFTKAHTQEKMSEFENALDAFQLRFESTLSAMDQSLKLWSQRAEKRGEANPNHAFELEWSAMYNRFLEGKKIVFAVSPVMKPDYDHGQDTLFTIQKISDSSLE